MHCNLSFAVINFFVDLFLLKPTIHICLQLQLVFGCFRFSKDILVLEKVKDHDNNEKIEGNKKKHPNGVD